jgi:DNA-directed RNA polymerase subunit RPC12/RpoP
MRGREYVCADCHQVLMTTAARGPVPVRCPPCKERHQAGEPLPPPVVEIVRNPFNSVPDRAPLPEPPARADIGPGLLTRSITAELATMRSTSPMAETLKASAILVAQAADAVPVEDLKQKMLAIKELRSIIDQLTKTAGGEDDGDNDGPFGSSAPALVHQTAV